MASSRDERRVEQLARVTCALGSFPAVVTSVVVVVVWALSGPLFGFSDTWQLLVNTGTTVFTFWMAFVIQNTQNRDGRAIQTKLDAILKATEAASDSLMGLEDRPEGEIKDAQEDLRGH